MRQALFIPAWLLGSMVLAQVPWPFSPETDSANMPASRLQGGRTIRQTAANDTVRHLLDGTPAKALKVPVATDDLIAVAFADIAAGLGLTPAEVAVLAETKTLTMRHGDTPVAYWLDSESQRIVFHGWPARSTYTQTNIFWIETGAPGDGRHMPRQTPDAIRASSNLTFPARRVIEEDLMIMTERGLMRDDLYFWKPVIAGDSRLGEQSFDVPLDGYAGGNLTMTLHLIGWNETAMIPDHLAEFFFNEVLLDTITFDGRDEVSATVTVPEDLLLTSGNRLKIKGVLQPEHTASLFVIDGFELQYQRYYEPANHLLRAGAGGHTRLCAARFDDPLVFDVTDPYRPTRIADASGLLPEDHSWPVTAGTHWIFRERDAVQAVTPQPGGFGAWMRETGNATDYLVIAPRAFDIPAGELAAYRETQGLRTAVAWYEDICDQFAGGLNSPEAIRDLLLYAHKHWDVAPWMVVLGGWGHYDYLGASTALINHLPPLLASDSVSLRPADGRFADMTGNGVPDLAIGRIPVQSAAQFHAYIDKLKAYETAGPQPWHERAVFVADRRDAGGDFTATNLEMAEEARKRYAIQQISRDRDSAATVKAALIKAFTNGIGIIHYTGHGSYLQLAGHPNLLHVDDVNTIENPTVPLFMSLTCLIGRFDRVSARSLGETLILRENGGALAVYAPSGLSRNHDGQRFGKQFYRLHAENKADAIGPALLRTRQTFGVISGSFNVSLRIYNLLGDPALKLRGGESGVPPRWVQHFAHWRWERFSIDELKDPVLSAPQTVAAGESLPNFLLYALDVAPGQGHIPSGLRMPRACPQGGLTTEWKRRRHAPDIEYRLRVSHDLKTWETEPSDLVTESIEVSGDDAIEYMRSRIQRCKSARLFIQLQINALEMP